MPPETPAMTRSSSITDSPDRAHHGPSLPAGLALATLTLVTMLGLGACSSDQKPAAQAEPPEWLELELPVE